MLWLIKLVLFSITSEGRPFGLKVSSYTSTQKKRLVKSLDDFISFYEDDFREDLFLGAICYLMICSTSLCIKSPFSLPTSTKKITLLLVFSCFHLNNIAAFYVTNISKYVFTVIKHHDSLIFFSPLDKILYMSQLMYT